jgi:hypothetical protein
VVNFGVLINLGPMPKRSLALEGAALFGVKSWKARLEGRLMRWSGLMLSRGRVSQRYERERHWYPERIHICFGHPFPREKLPVWILPIERWLRPGVVVLLAPQFFLSPGCCSLLAPAACGVGSQPRPKFRPPRPPRPLCPLQCLPPRPRPCSFLAG